MAELTFWLLILPAMSLIAVLVLLREQLFDSQFFLWLRGLIGFFTELLVVYDLWPNCFLEELARELEEQQRVQLTYTPLLIDDSCPEMHEEVECTKV